MDNAVEVQNLSKSFGTVRSNQNISLTVKKGEILALLGENGSGKSTFVNMLAGIYTPESGTISINGEVQHFSSPQDAIAAGIGMVHQHFKLVEVMSALENITLGERKAGFFIQKNKIAEKIRQLAEQFGFAIDLDKKGKRCHPLIYKGDMSPVRAFYVYAQLLNYYRKYKNSII